MKIEELLFNDQPITINRKLAKCLGLKEAVVFQQIHYWLEINKKTNNNFLEGRYWTYNSVKNWHTNEFDFLSLKTLQRTLKSLEDDGLILCGDFNKMKGDKTKWYSINYEKLLEVCEKRLNEKEVLSSKRAEIGKLAASAKKEKNKENREVLEPMLPNWSNGGACDQIGQTMLPNWSNHTTKLVKPIPETTTETTTETTISSSKGKAPLDFSEGINYFEKNICTLGKTTKEKFINILEQNNLDFIKAVIDYCKDKKATSFAYFEKAITSYLEKNINTKELLEKSINEFKAEMEKRKIAALKEKQDFKIPTKEKRYAIKQELDNKVKFDVVESLEDLNAIKEVLKKDIPEIGFKTWIEQLVIKKENDTVKIFAVNDFSKETVKKKYELNIIKALISCNVTYKEISYELIEI